MQEKFLEEIRRFNSSFSLGGNREAMSESQATAEILNLQKEVDSIYKGSNYTMMTSNTDCVQSALLKDTANRFDLALVFICVITLASSAGENLSFQCMISSIIILMWKYSNSPWTCP